MAPAHNTESPPSLGPAPWLARPETQAVFAALEDAGHVARAVGGAVRNALLGAPVTDVDIATTARPDQIVAAAAAAGLKTIVTGLEHGTVTVIAGRLPYQVTTLRRDVATFGRHAAVAFTDDWTVDASRRDFTINALYCGRDGAVQDPLGGYRDLVARHVRFIGDADERIREDYLRILRFFRLHAEHGRGAPDGAGLLAAVRARAGLRQLSGERIRQELVRLLVAPGAGGALTAMLDHGLLVDILALAPRPLVFSRLAAIEAALGIAPNAMLRLCAVAVAVSEDAERLRDRLRLANAEFAVLQRWAACAPRLDPAMPERAAKVLLYRLGAEPYRECILKSWALGENSADAPVWASLLALPERWRLPAFPLKGEDVLALGVPPGPSVGEVLEVVEAWWVAADFPAEQSALATKLAEATRHVQSNSATQS